MMKKSILKITMSLVLGISCLFSAAACKKGNSSDTDDSGNVTFETMKHATDTVTGNQLMLVENKATNYQVVYPAESTTVEVYAADFLANTLKSATGASMQKVTDASIGSFDPNKYCIYVGDTQQFDEAGLTVDLELGDDGFLIANKGNGIFICGSGQMGHVYGVQEFLSYEIDFEAYSGEEVYYNKVSSVAMLDFENLTVSPTFAFRRSSTPGVADIAEAALMRVNLGGTGSTLAGSIWSTFQYHSLPQLVTDPSWFNNGQLCQSNPDALEHIAQRMSEIILQADESTKYFELGNADTSATCGCADCVQSAAENGGFGGVYIIWLNKVAERVAEIYAEQGIEREYYLVALAYLGYMSPPTVFNEATQKYEPVNDKVICREDVAVRFCTIHACSTHAFNDPTCTINVQAGLQAQCEGWGAVTENAKYMLYMYGTDFKDYFFFYNDITSIKANAEYLRDIGATDLYIQMESNPNGPFAALRDYLRSKIWWDATLDINELIEDFFYHYYREGAEYMLEYFNAIQANFVHISNLMDNGGCMGYNKIGGEYKNANYWSYELLRSYQKTVEKAYKAVKDAGYSEEEYEKIRLRILADEMFIKNLYIRWHSAKLADIEQYKADFIADNLLLGNSYSAEGGLLG